MATLESQFEAFAKFGGGDGKAITLTNSDKWMKQAKVIDGKKITTTDTGIAFNKFKSKALDFATWKRFVEDLAGSKQRSADELFGKLTNCGAAGTTGATKAVAAGGVERLTDTSKYTGSHKERFDESGKGRGLEGRVDKPDASGYVQGYKGKDTYDEKNK